MAKRGRKPKKKIDVSSMKSIFTSAVSLLLLLIGVISILSIFSGLFNSDGEVNGKLHQLLADNFGLMAIFVPIITIYAGLLIIGTIKWKFLSYRVLSGILLLYVGLSGITGSIAGEIGVFLQISISELISLPGAIFLYIVVLIFAIILVTNKGLDSYASYIANILNFIKEKIFRININGNEGEIKDASLELDSEEDENLQLEMGDDDEKDYQINGYKYGETSDAKDNEEVLDIELEEGKEVTKIKEKKDKNFEIITPPSGPVDDEKDLLNGSAINTANIQAAAETSDTTSKNSVSNKANSNDVEIIEGGESTEDTQQTVGATLDNKLPFSNKLWEYPSLSLLSNVPNEQGDAGNVNERAKIIEDTLKAFGVKADIADVNIGPAFTRYDLNLAIGTKANKILNLSTDLALRIKSPSGSVRVVAPIPGTNLVGIEVPNFKPSTVSLHSVMETSQMKSAKSKLTVALGHDVGGKPVIQDISKWPHCLVAGATGSGKSVMLNTIISTLLLRCSPQECRFIMIDPKMVELSGYNDIPHLLTPVVTDVEQKAVSALAWAVSEMERRYEVFSNAKVRNIESYNTLSGFQAEPYIVIVIDELADMMMVAPSDVEKYITRLAQKSRAVGIHLIIATQRPSVNVLTGTIKANIPTRIAFKVTSNVDSRVIIDQSGAEALIGRGDMLFIPPNDSKPSRIQGVWVSDDEINNIVDFIKGNGLDLDYREEITEQAVISNKASGSGGAAGDVDDKTAEALEIIINEGKASASYLQRKLGIGYSRAARMIDIFEESGIIGQARGSKPREVLTYSVDEALSKITGKNEGGITDDA